MAEYFSTTFNTTEAATNTNTAINTTPQFETTETVATITTTNTAGPIGPLITQPASIQNVNPINIPFKNTIILGTTDSNNNNAVIDEGYVVSGPTSPGVSPIVIAGGSKVVIQLTTSTAQGAAFLKIHYPLNPNGKNVYVTYCVANNKMVDGYYDYITGVPSSYFQALRGWINTAPNGTQYSNNNAFTIRERILYFSDFGNLTNKPANSISFQVKFQGTFGPAINNDETVKITKTF